ncbi:MAG: hypothetical protein JRC60_00480 [Deltaproteobacteria bacterium]|nr:hypothetical protein [Deltaproteobacteria bacterium]
MENKQLNDLLKQSGDTDLAILLGAKENAKRNLMDDPSSANLSAFEKASKMVDDRVSGEQSFKNRPEALRYLQTTGHKIKKSKLYKDVKKGLLKMEPDGSILRSSIDQYIAHPMSGLIQPDESDDDDTKGLTLERLQADTDRLKAQAEHWALKNLREKGLVVYRSEFEQALAARAILLKEDLRNFARGEIPDIIKIVAGDPNKNIELMEYLLERVDDWLNRYSENPEIRSPEPETDEEEDEAEE